MVAVGWLLRLGLGLVLRAVRSGPRPRWRWSGWPTRTTAPHHLSRYRTHVESSLCLVVVTRLAKSVES